MVQMPNSKVTETLEGKETTMVWVENHHSSAEARV